MMSNPLGNITGITKPNLVVFFVVDRSGSMSFEGKMNSVNHAMREAIPILRGVGGSDSDVKVAVLMFSDGAVWMYDSPVAVEDFTWEDVTPGGYTEFGAACNELYDKLSRSKYMNSRAGYRKPIIILLSDGEPTDETIWPSALERLKTNNWFKLSYKIALAVDSADEGVLGDFVGSRFEGVYKVEDVQKLKAVLKAVVITSSQIGKNSRPVNIDEAGGIPSTQAENISESADIEAEKEMHNAIQTAIEEAENPYAPANDVDDSEWED
jgi:uncharacterized protein YegL